jgi:hypothetical protein
LYTVKRIFHRVDQVFKERKDACLQLVWEISDLENQLECLQKNTRDYCELSATQGASLSWTTANVDRLTEEMNDLQSKFLNPLREEQEKFNEIKEESKCLCGIFICTYNLYICDLMWIFCRITYLANQYISQLTEQFKELISVKDALEEDIYKLVTLEENQCEEYKRLLQEADTMEHMYDDLVIQTEVCLSSLQIC